MIARVCEGDVPVSTTRTCRPKQAVVQDDSCSSYATCGYALDLGPGLSARAVDYFRAECVPREDPLVMESRFDCSCTGDSFATKNYLVTAPSIDDVCDPMREVCLAEGEPTFTERRCRDFAPAGTVEGVCPAGEDCQGCMIYRECGLVAPIAEEVSILSFVNLDYRYILCRPTQGELQCTCEASLYGVYSDESVPSEVLDVCRESSGVCPL